MKAPVLAVVVAGMKYARSRKRSSLEIEAALAEASKERLQNQPEDGRSVW